MVAEVPDFDDDGPTVVSSSFGSTSRNFRVPVSSSDAVTQRLSFPAGAVQPAAPIPAEVAPVFLPSVASVLDPEGSEPSEAQLLDVAAELKAEAAKHVGWDEMELVQFGQYSTKVSQKLLALGSLDAAIVSLKPAYTAVCSVPGDVSPELEEVREVVQEAWWRAVERRHPSQPDSED